MGVNTGMEILTSRSIGSIARASREADLLFLYPHGSYGKNDRHVQEYASLLILQDIEECEDLVSAINSFSLVAVEVTA